MTINTAGLDPKALGAARKRLERMMHTRGYMGRGRVTISGPMHGPILSAREVAAEIVAAYLSAALPTQQGFKEGVETAAKVADQAAVNPPAGWPYDENGDKEVGWTAGASYAAKAIRALSDQPADPAPSTASGVVK